MPQQQQQDTYEYDYIVTNPLTIAVRPVERETGKNSNIRMDTKPADNKGNVKSSEDTEYVINNLSQTKNDDIEMYKNPSYAETKFT